MSKKLLITTYWRQTLAIAFAIGVYCMWYIFYPHILMTREQSSLFVWDWAFVEDRLAMPWGWVGLGTAFVKQFFYNSMIGALVMALLSLFTFWLTYRLLRLISNSWWLYCLSFVPAIYVCCLPLNPPGGTEEEMEYDYLVRQGKWSAIIQKYQKQAPQSLACQNAVRLALFQTGQLSRADMFYGVTTSKHALSSRAAAFIMSDVYIYMGMTAMSQRTTFEAMESIEDYNKSGRSLQRLAVTSLICGQPALARKYLLLLEKTIFYSDWAKETMPMALHPERIATHPSLGKLQEMLKVSDDVFFY